MFEDKCFMFEVFMFEDTVASDEQRKPIFFILSIQPSVRIFGGSGLLRLSCLA
jgi:hypothetical protein